jgi:hypothetical protein
MKPLDAVLLALIFAESFGMVVVFGPAPALVMLAALTAMVGLGRPR